MFNVYDKVWVIRNNQLKQMLVFAVIESMGYYKRKDETEKHYKLVDDYCGAGWGNNEGVRFNGDDMFNTKEELINSLSS